MSLYLYLYQKGSKDKIYSGHYYLGASMATRSDQYYKKYIYFLSFRSEDVHGSRSSTTNDHHPWCGLTRHPVDFPRSSDANGLGSSFLLQKGFKAKAP